MAKIQLNSQKSTSSPTQETTVSNTSTQTLTQTFIEPISKNTTAEELRQMTKTLHDQYKKRMYQKLLRLVRLFGIIVLI